MFTYPAPLIPKLRGYFAEFLNHDSLDRLSILYSSTCVGFGYGRLMTSLTKLFSAAEDHPHHHTECGSGIRSQTPKGTDLPTPRPTPLPWDNHRPGWATFLRHSVACLLHVWVAESPHPATRR